MATINKIHKILDSPSNTYTLSMDGINASFLDEFLMDSTYKLACSILQIKGDMNELTNAYLTIYEDRYLDFLRYLIDTEISNVTEAHAIELLRGNSPSIKMLTEYAYIVSTDYLRQVLEVPFSMIFKSVHGYEVNPDKILDLKDLSLHQQELEAIAQSILDRLVSIPFPPPLACVCLYLRRSVAARFHAHTDTVLGSYLFLRVLCPMIIMPYHTKAFPLLDKSTVPPHALRSCVLVAKLLQNLVNNAFFKEEYMTVFNPFIRRNFVTVVAFYDRICNCDMPVSPLPPPMDRQTALMILQNRQISAESKPIIKPAITRRLSSSLSTAPDDESVSSATMSLDRNQRMKTRQTELIPRGAFFLSHRGIPVATPIDLTSDYDLTLKVHFVELAHRGLQSLLSAIDDSPVSDCEMDAVSWRILQQKHGITVYSRERRGIFEMKATICIQDDTDTCFNFISSPNGRELWSTWGHEVRVLESVSDSSRIVHRTNYGHKFPSFIFWCCMQLQDACEFESIFSPSPEGVHCHALLFQSIGRVDVPPVQGVVRSHLYSSGFVVRPDTEDQSQSLVTFSIRMDNELRPLQAKPYLKQILTLSKLKQAIERIR